MTAKNKPSNSRRLPVILAVLAALAGGAFLYQKITGPDEKGSQSASVSSPESTTEKPKTFKDTPAPAEPPASTGQGILSLSPANTDIRAGTNFTVEVRLDTAGEAVNAVEAELSYPADKLQFVGIDAAGSAFSIEAQASGGKGKVTLARGNIADVTGKVLVGKVSFKPVVKGGEVEIGLTNNSRSLRTADTTNIVAQRNGGRYSIAD